MPFRKPWRGTVKDCKDRKLIQCHVAIKFKNYLEFETLKKIIIPTGNNIIIVVKAAVVREKLWLSYNNIYYSKIFRGQQF